MILASDSHFICPECEAVHARSEIMSGNTFHAVYYSDGKMEAPYLPAIPWIIRCQQCALVFCLESWMRMTELPEKDVKIFAAHWPDIKGWMEAISAKLYTNDVQEFNFRCHLMWTYHDPYRNEPELECKLNDSPTYIQNIERMLELLDLKELDNLVYAVEMNRLIGRFEASQAMILEFIENYDSEQFSPYIEGCRERNNKFDSKVFRL